MTSVNLPRRQPTRRQAAASAVLFQEPLYEGRLPDAGLLGTGCAAALVTLTVGMAVFLRHQDQHIHHF